MKLASAPYGIWVPHMRMGQSSMHMGSPYGYIHMDRPILMWAKYACGLEQLTSYYNNAHTSGLDHSKECHLCSPRVLTESQDSRHTTVCRVAQASH